ncbi:hypothetical protein E2C01_020018 [Portunus trituberculatus]|uniref:Uncharacterized protein n=1 Tax=Portunus trituberculatus TaxID=210409 RepID=A0A5B7E0L7_PORTR|nr:hypothetical protein [Portunus trituberculatus]
MGDTHHRFSIFHKLYHTERRTRHRSGGSGSSRVLINPSSHSLPLLPAFIPRLVVPGTSWTGAAAGAVRGPSRVTPLIVRRRDGDEFVLHHFGLTLTTNTNRIFLESTPACLSRQLHMKCYEGSKSRTSVDLTWQFPDRFALPYILLSRKNPDWVVGTLAVILISPLMLAPQTGPVNLIPLIKMKKKKHVRKISIRCGHRHLRCWQ